jgi:hypothetical protein
MANPLEKSGMSSLSLAAFRCGLVFRLLFKLDLFLRGDR